MPASKKKQVASAAGGGSGKKQKNLYSFFSVAKTKPKPKPSSTKAAAKSPSPSSSATASKTAVTSPDGGGGSRNKAAATTTAASIPSPAGSTKTVSASSSATKSDMHNLLVKKVQLNSKLAVHWKDDNKFYACVVTKKEGNRFFIEYDDGDTEWLDLRQEKFRFVDNDDSDAEEEEEESDDDDMDVDEEKTSKQKQPTTKKKRPRIHDSDDEEYEFDLDAADDDDDDDDDEEAFADEEEESDDKWLVSDDDDEDDQPRKKKRAKASSAKKVSVTQHKASNDSSPSSSSARMVPKTPRPTSTSNAAATMTPTSLSSFSAFSQSASKTNAPRRVTPLSSGRPTATPVALESAEKGSGGPMNFIMGVVNPAGSHVHNHLDFLLNPRDAQGRTKGQPGYDPRTLKVDNTEYIKMCKIQKMTPGTEQWWATKAQYFDTVLLFKTGKFYEMFHMDADIGVQVLNFNYMKGHVAHAGFPEVSYGVMADKLVRAGYKVARVEQTETPEMLKQRKKKMRGPGAPKALNREVCSIMSLGTRTFCYLDLEEIADDGKATAESGPLLAIREVQYKEDGEGMQDDDEDALRPVCEYGIVVVDAARAHITIGQFADDVLRSRMSTLIATFAPSEILLEGGENGASATLRALLKSLQTTSGASFLVEDVLPMESFPKSTAVDPAVRRRMERGKVKPWDPEQTIKELHRRGYYPKGSKQQDSTSISRWPRVLRSCVEGKAELALSSFGAALFYLQRNLIDGDILSMGNVKAYIPPVSPVASEGKLTRAEYEDSADGDLEAASSAGNAPLIAASDAVNEEDKIKNMSIDGNTLVQLEILNNSIDHKPAGSLWSKINHTNTPHGERLLRAWLLRPLFRKTEIDRRADAVDELLSGDVAMAMEEARKLLNCVGDIDRLCAKIHGMSGSQLPGAEDETCHPNTRAILYETKTYTKRKVGDFSRCLNGLRSASKIPELFARLNIESGFLKNIVTTTQDGGFFPDITGALDFFFSTLDVEAAAAGEFEPGRGIDADFDEACEAIDQIHAQLEEFKNDMCTNVLSPLAKSTWKYANTLQESKDKFMIELPASIKVPSDFRMVGKRGSGAKQINKYRAAEVEDLVVALERAIGVHKERKARQMQFIFAKFDEKRTFWAAVASCTASLDALGSLATVASQPDYCRPKILDCPLDASPCINIIQGRHPCVEATPGRGEFIPNDLRLGSQVPGEQSQKVLLLSGPNMGGKSTLLRQTCLISILAQIGCFVPAAECELTPLDNIMTRLGASDRILLGQSTFFVELAETAAALRGSTRRSLVLFDELGRGTSSFDGTAIASACLSYICNNLGALALFATHYHSLLKERMDDPTVRLAHMESTVDEEEDGENITFLYSLGEGPVANSFGINVARLARLPEEVLSKAKRVSTEFEMELSGEAPHTGIGPEQAVQNKQRLLDMIKKGQAGLDDIEALWSTMQQ